MQIKHVNPQVNVLQSALEWEIDQLIAPSQLYGLTDNEVKIVENKE